MVKYLFVGEKRSNKAVQMKVTWKDGRLAAKQLFDALHYCGINPIKQDFCNWFEGGKNKVRTTTLPIVAMGRKVSNALKQERINHIFIFHPATRGKIRKKELYLEHVKQALNVNST